MLKKSTSGKNMAIKVISLVACCAVLLGATYAWIKPSDSTIVNSINAGELTIDLVDVNDNTLVGKTLGFVDAGNNISDVVWEPGHTNTAQICRLKNNGVVNVKYKLKVIGLSGSSGIAERISWKVNGEDIADFTAGLAAGESAELVITGTMDPKAGNRFMDRTGDSVAIAIYAAEDNDEADFEEIVAIVRDIDNLPTARIYRIQGGYAATDEIVALNAAFSFSPVPGAPEEKYAQWNSDYVVSFDREIDPEKVCLAGQYNSWSEEWIGFKNPVTLAAGQELRLLNSIGIYKTYEEICTDVENFKCGVANLGLPAGTVMTVDLRVYERDASGAETGKYVTAGSYIYTF